VIALYPFALTLRAFATLERKRTDKSKNKEWSGSGPEKLENTG